MEQQQNGSTGTGGVPPAPAPTRRGQLARDLSAYLRGRYGCLWLVADEEGWAESAIVDAALMASMPPRFWDCAGGVTDAAGREVPPGRGCVDAGDALNAVRASAESGVWVLRDLDDKWLDSPAILRGLRSLARSLPVTEPPRTVVVLTSSRDVPRKLRGNVTVVEVPLPDRREVGGILDDVLRGMDPSLYPQNGAREAAIEAAVGLTEQEATNVFSRSLVTTRRIDPAVVTSEKRRVIARAGVGLSWVEPLAGGLDAVGGLDLLKGWLLGRRADFSQRARDYGIPLPKGVLLVGVPGCGKSLTAKCVPSTWGVPLICLDLGGLKSKYVGESEGNLRRALAVAEAVAPCVLWFDELEKGLGGGGDDGGVTKDYSGTVLSWMQERAAPVFVVATANDVSALPPEMLRKGRFDELFFVDLPTAGERGSIYAATLRATLRVQAPESVGERFPGDLASLVAASEGFSGAECASVVEVAMRAGFANGGRPIVFGDLLTAARAIVPASRTSAEDLARKREWAKGRARLASTPDATGVPVGGGGRGLKL